MVLVKILVTTLLMLKVQSTAFRPSNPFFIQETDGNLVLSGTTYCIFYEQRMPDLSNAEKEI